MLDLSGSVSSEMAQARIAEIIPVVGMGGDDSQTPAATGVDGAIQIRLVIVDGLAGWVAGRPGACGA